MAIRSTATEVKAISGSTLSDSEIEAFILPASLIIDKLVSSDSISDDDLTKQAEIFLSCHLVMVSGKGGSGGSVVMSEKVEGVDLKYAITMSKGEGLLSTPYGRTANVFTNGLLASFDMEPASIGFF